MKIIFLDIDGVLNVIPQGFDLYGGIFHPEFVDNLQTIIDKTGAKIVISSTWKASNVEEMWNDRNLPGEVVGTTPFSWELERFKDFDGRIPRGEEIQEYLDFHKDITNYVILDDDTDMLKSQMENFIQTSENPNHPDCIDIGYGLTKQCTKKAIKILNK